VFKGYAPSRMAYPSTVKTERLVLHRWDPEAHSPALTNINAQPVAVTYLNAGVPYTAHESRAQSERFTAHWDRYGFGLWAVEVAGEVVGFAGAAHPMWFPAYLAEVELGWRFDPRAWGNGYATEAARAAAEAAFTHLELDRLIACIDPENTPSLAVAERLGMTLDVTVEHPQRPGPLAIYELSASAPDRD